MKILLFGSSGMLGNDIADVFSDKHEVINKNRTAVDITIFEDVNLCIQVEKPDVVINCTAFTKVDDCEIQREKALMVNGYAPVNLAEACLRTECKLVHISTDYVFDGKKTAPYIEEDLTNPLNVYGHSKLIAETGILNTLEQSYIIRTQWLFGLHGNNFVDTIIKLANTKKSLSVVNDQFGCPTYTKDIAEAILKLIESDEYGVYHLTNAGIVSWYDFAKKILILKGINNIAVHPSSTQDSIRLASRPSYTPLKNHRWQTLGGSLLPDYEHALYKYIHDK